MKFFEKMRCSSVCLIFGFIYGTGYSVSASGNHLPFTTQPIPAKTPQAININTKNVKNIVTEPLTLVIGTSEKVRLINTGYSVEVIIESPLTSTFAFGGVLGLDIYVYSRQIYYFSNKTGGIAGTTVNGKGGQRLEGGVYYYNHKYGSFENALKHRDGIFEIISRIIVTPGNFENKVFNTFAPYLEKVFNPGSSTIMPITPTYAFYNRFPENVMYYAFPGAFINATTGKQHYSTTTIVKPVLPYRFISQNQFDQTFGMMLDKNGKKLNTAVPQLPANGRPIVSTSGITEYQTPLAFFPVQPGGV